MTQDIGRIPAGVLAEPQILSGLNPSFLGVKEEIRLGNGIYGHSRFCNTDFDDKLACLNLSGV